MFGKEVAAIENYFDVTIGSPLMTKSVISPGLDHLPSHTSSSGIVFGVTVAFLLCVKAVIHLIVSCSIMQPICFTTQLTTVRPCCSWSL